jgi:hypothetical protein
MNSKTFSVNNFKISDNTLYYNDESVSKITFEHGYIYNIFNNAEGKSLLILKMCDNDMKMLSEIFNQLENRYTPLNMYNGKKYLKVKITKDEIDRKKLVKGKSLNNFTANIKYFYIDKGDDCFEGITIWMDK